MFARQIIQYKWLIIGIVLLLVAGSVLVLPRLKVDVGFSTFFPKGDPQLTFYEDFTSKMGSTDPFIFLPIKPSADKVFDQQFLTRIDAFAEDCQQIPAIKKVSSITNSMFLRRQPISICHPRTGRRPRSETGR